MFRVKRRFAAFGAAALVGALAVALLAGCGSQSTTPTQQPASTAGAQGSIPPTATVGTGTTLASGLQIVDQAIGTGPAAKAGDKVTVNYTGYLTNGTKFDSSLDRNQPFSFTLGAGEVIEGWDQGVVGMQVGGKRRLTIPAKLGYGAQGAGGGKIPPNATLVFDIELLKIG